MVFDTIMGLVKNDELMGAMAEFDAQAPIGPCQPCGHHVVQQIAPRRKIIGLQRCGIIF